MIGPIVGMISSRPAMIPKYSAPDAPSAVNPIVVISPIRARRVDIWVL
jgi:hypothetical protein